MRTNIIWTILIFTVLCLAGLACKSIAYYEEMGAIGREMQAGKLSEEGKRDRLAAAYIKTAGQHYLWHAACFISFCAALALAYADTKKWWARLAYTVLTLVVFSLGATVFLVAEENVEFLEAGTHAILFGSIIKVKLASAIVSLIAGGLVFEMISGLFAADEKSH
jgi:hypothetical protein